MRTWAYYVSGHGHGHARRCAEILRELGRMIPDWKVLVRTTAPAQIFHDLAGGSVSAPEIAFDAGAVEDDVCTIQPQGTIAAVRRVIGQKDRIIEQELRFLQSSGCDGLFADIPFMAGEIAHAADLPCLGISNFTWDFIYAPMLGPQEQGIMEEVRAGYARMTGLVRLAMPQPQIPLPLVGQVHGLITQRSLRPTRQILEDFGLADERRPKVLFAMRGGGDWTTIKRAVAGAPEFLFLFTQAPPGEVSAAVRVLPETDRTGFHDLLAISDIVLSKLGSGIVSDCVAAGVRLLHPRKVWFREDELTGAYAQTEGTALEMPVESYKSGEWQPFLQELMRMDTKPPQPATGAREAAEFIRKWAETVS